MKSPETAHPRLVLTSTSSAEEAERIARHLVESRLAGCVKLLPGVQSFYRWQDEVESASEIMVLIKTSASHVAEVEAAIASLHSYEVPEFLVLPIESGSAGYLEWLFASLR